MERHKLKELLRSVNFKRLLQGMKIDIPYGAFVYSGVITRKQQLEGLA